MNINFTDDFFKQGREIHRFGNVERDELESYPNERNPDRKEPEAFDPWAIPWPKIPGGGEPYKLPLPDEGGNNCPCQDSKNVMGYYIPWHFMLEQQHYYKTKGSNRTIECINKSYPECRQWGIHICMDNINNYIDHCLMPEVRSHLTDAKEQKYFRDYAVYLMVMKTVAHEWGHYRVELLALQQMEAMSTIMKAEDVCHFSGNYLKYFRSTARTHNDFEEVFAEWCALRYGVYNSKMIRPDDLPEIFQLRKNEITKDWLIRRGVLDSMRKNSSPYGDITTWIDFNKLESDILLYEYVKGEITLSKVIGKYTKTNRFKIIDLIMHNINCFSKENIFSNRNQPFVSNNWKWKREIASLRPSIGLDQNPQGVSFDIKNYGRKKTTLSSVLSLDKPLLLDSFKYPIYRLPLENLSLLPVKVYH